jgi:hypothetical protein
MCSRRASSLAVVLALTSVGRARADVQLPFAPRVAATLSNGQQALEAGVEHTIGGAPDTDDGTRVGPASTTVTSGRVFVALALPFGSGTVVRIDKNTSDWRLTLGGDLAYARRAEADDASQLDHSRSRYGMALSAGHAEYAYSPGAGTVQQTEAHWSISGGAHAIWIHARQSEMWAPQVALTYDRSYAASTPVGIVSPAMPDSPALVMRTVSIAAPSTSPTLAARVSCPYALWPDTQFLIGPSLSHTFAGADRALSPFGGDSGRLEGELWIYYLPKLDPKTGATNVRIGVAPFASARTYGDDGQDRFTYGALAELRINSEIFDY